MALQDFYREFSDVKRDVEYLNSLDRPRRDSLQSAYGGLLTWSKQNVGTTEEIVEVRSEPIVDVYGYIAFVFSSSVTTSYFANIGIHGPTTSQVINLTDPSTAEFELFVDPVDTGTLKLKKNSGDDAFIVNGFFFIL